jgi:hypothetical protein
MTTHGHSGPAVRDSYQIGHSMWMRGRNVIAFLMLVSYICCAFGFAFDRTQFFHSYLFGFVYFMMICLGALFFVQVQFLTGSAWSVPVRRFMENIAACLPLGALLFVPVALGMHALFSWSHDASDPMVAAKAGYLNPQFFLIRAAIYFLIWTVWSGSIYVQSTRQDTTKSIRQMHAMSAWSAPGLLLLFLTATLASFDWVMSLNPKWYSTIFGIYCLAGGGLAFMAVVTLISLGFRGAGVLKHTINVEHYHDLGKWMFAITVFWAYIAFSQYMLIWYANIPEETIFFKMRSHGSWGYWSILLIVGHFIVPFLVLLGRAAKRNFQVLALMAGWILAMHFVDIYWLVMPNFTPYLNLHWMDFAAFVAVGSTMALLFWWRLKQHALLPVGDMRFEEGLAFENA